MENPKDWKKQLLRIGSYIVVAALSSALTLFVFGPSLVNSQSGKLQEVKSVIKQYYIGEADEALMDDMAAAAMVAATGDKWSYYVPADQLQDVLDSNANSYVGIGVTVQLLEDESGYTVQRVEPGSPAKEGDIRPGDVIVGVNGKMITDVGAEPALDMIRGEPGTSVNIHILRDGEMLEKALTRQKVLQEVASGQMLTDTTGYIQINNFNERCASETISLIDELEKQGAKAMIFDVRFNPGGYVTEMVKVLDYLLPEGVLFRSEFYTGETDEETSDASCKNMPIAVLINSESYSAAEFFAAALKEYEYAITVGQPTTGKGHFQQLLMLSDGSAINLSVGRYYTPNGVSLSEVGGLTPDVLVDVDLETMALIYSDSLPLEEDTQLQAAVDALEKQ